MKNAKWSARFFKFVYPTRHSHVTRPEPIKLLHFMNVCPPGFHLMFIFAQMEPKTCGPPDFLFSEKPGRPLVFFNALFVRSTAFYAHFRVDTVTSESSICIPSSHHLFS